MCAHTGIVLCAHAGGGAGQLPAVAGWLIATWLTVQHLTTAWQPFLLVILRCHVSHFSTGPAPLQVAAHVVLSQSGADAGHARGKSKCSGWYCQCSSFNVPSWYEVSEVDSVCCCLQLLARVGGLQLKLRKGLTASLPVVWPFSLGDIAGCGAP
jgi:hypothetical protein